MKEVNLNKLRKRIKNTVPSKNNELYSSYLYWSQKPFNICDILIDELSNSGDVIFDPFMGSGVTVMEAVRKQYNRIGIGCEINEEPIFLVETLMKNYDLDKYEKDAIDILNRLEKINKLYFTLCPNCGGEAYASTTVFDIEEEKYSVKYINCICPNCGRTKKEADANDYKKMSYAYKYKNIKIEKMHENSKLAVYKDETVENIFTPRNLKALDILVGLIKEYKYSRRIFEYILLSSIHLAKITDTHSNSQWPLWIPKRNCVEKNVSNLFKTRVKNFSDTIKYINNNYDDNIKFKIIKKGSQFINQKDIKNNSIDLIITDPPYLGQVAYSEYMQLYKPFFDLDYNLKDEIIVTTTPDRRISKEEYFYLLRKVFTICGNLLKENHYMCMYFHDASLPVWAELIEIMEDCEFKYCFQEHIHKTSTLKNIISPKNSLSGDALIVFKKSVKSTTKNNINISLDKIEDEVIEKLNNKIKNEGPKSTSEIYDEWLIEFLINKGWLSALSTRYTSIVQLLEKYYDWNPKNNNWSLKT